MRERPDPGQVDLRRAVGDASAPIQLGVTTRDQVVDRLGVPLARSVGDSVFAYHGHNRVGYWVSIGWGIEPNYEAYFLLLEFDLQGIARRHAVKRETFSGGIDDGTSLAGPWRDFTGTEL